MPEQTMSEKTMEKEGGAARRDQRCGAVIADVVFPPAVGAGDEQGQAQQDHPDGTPQKHLVEILHIVIHPGTRYRGLVQVVRAPDGAVQRVIQIGHDAQ